jgi:hypothetical protein
MFYVFGWGRRTTRDLGPTIPGTCPNCKNQTWFHFRSYRTWFSIMLVPLIPYESKMLLVCPICSRGLELRADQAEKAKHVNGLAKSFLAGTLRQDDFLAAVRRIHLVPASDGASVMPDPSGPTSAAQEEEPRVMASQGIPIYRTIAFVLIVLVVVAGILWTTDSTRR